MAYTEEDKYKHQAYQFLVDQMRRQKGEEMSGLANLIRASETNPEAGAAALSRYGINAPAGPSRREAALRQQMQLAAFREAIRGKRGGGGLPPDLVGSIGTPDFGRRLQDAMTGGSVDRQGLQTLYDLDRKEREFQTKGIAKPGKLSPFAQRLREMEALGIPVTEEVVRSVYTPSAVVPSAGDPTRKGRSVSLGALAGLVGGATQDTGSQPIADEETPMAPAEDRRSRLRSILSMGTEY